MLRNKVTSKCANLPFSFYYEIRGEKIWANLRIGDNDNYKEKSRQLERHELDTILKVISEVPLCSTPFVNCSKWKDAYIYRCQVFMPMVESFFAEDWDRLL